MPADYKPFDKAEWLRLEKKADELRRLTLKTANWGGSGHLGGAMSCMDAMTILYHRFMKLDPNDSKMPDRDRFILSKGHAAVGYAPVLVDFGYMPEEELHIFNLTGAKIGMHLDANKVNGCEFSTGSLGHGMSLAVGFALAGRVNGIDYMNYIITGDGELNEGSNWEAAMSAAQYKLSNYVVLVDNNKCMIDGRVADEMNIEPVDKKFEVLNKILSGEAFGSGHKYVHYFFSISARRSCMYARDAIFSLVSATLSSLVLLELNSVRTLRFSSPSLKNLS